MDNKEEKYVVTKDFYVALGRCRGYLTTADFLPKADSDVIEISSREYRNAIRIIEDNVAQITRFFMRNRDVGNYEPDLFSRVIELTHQYEELKSNPDISKEEIANKVAKLGPELINTNEFMHVLCILKEQKAEYESSLEYYRDVESLADWSARFDEAFKERNIEKIVSVLNELVELNRQSIVECVNDKSDDDFAFIGHSLRETTDDLRGTFKNRYVSASLFNSEFNDTYNDGFGYIMSAKHIVSAYPRDIFTNNAASDSNELMGGRYVPKMSHPTEILKIMRERREKNEENAKSYREYPGVYSEIVLDGFEPIGIFCFTNGLKEFDKNYVRALELKKNCPDLELKVFDVLKFKKGRALEEEKLKMLNAIQRKLEANLPYTEEIRAIDVPLYERFFIELDKLKQNGNYTTADIERIFYETKDLRTTTSYELFEMGKEYSDEDIKYILGKGRSFNIELILSSKAHLSQVNCLSNLSKYVSDERCKSIMNKCYPGLAEFAALVKRVNLTNAMYEEIKQKGLLNFSDMNRYLYKVVKDKMEKEQITFAEEKDATKIELEKRKLRLEDLYKRREEEENEIKEYENMKRIANSEYQFKIIEKDVLSAETELEALSLKKQEYQTEKKQLEEKIDSKTKEKEIYEKNKEEYEIKYTALIKEIHKLEKHPFINKKKIAIKKELKELSDSGAALYADISTPLEYERSINVMTSNLDICQHNLEQCENEERDKKKIIEEAKEVLMKMYGKGDIAGAKEVIEAAKEALEEYDADYLNELNWEIRKTLVIIREAEEKIQNIEILEQNMKKQNTDTL